MKKLNKHTNAPKKVSFKQESKLERIKYVALAFIFMSLVMAVGKVYVQQSHADTFNSSAEAEHGTPSPSAKVISDPSASESSAVMFDNPKVGKCIAPSGLKITDIDFDHTSIDHFVPWRHKLGDAATIYYETHNVSAAYADYVKTGGDIWDASPCIDIKVVDTCPPSTNCVTAVMVNDTNVTYDGQFREKKDANNRYMISGSINFVKAKLDKETPEYVRMVVAHEMGHSVSLAHRLTVNNLMNWSSDEHVPMEADPVALNNILAVYGVQSGATDAFSAANNALPQNVGPTIEDAVTDTFPRNPRP